MKAMVKFAQEHGAGISWDNVNPFAPKALYVYSINTMYMLYTYKRDLL